MLDKNPSYIVVLDQGSRGGPPIINSQSTKSLLIDHHLSDEFPERAVVRDFPKPTLMNSQLIHLQVVSGCHCPPVPTTSLLTYEICKTLHPTIEPDCGYLCAIGTHGDLGNTLKWQPPFPDMSQTFKLHTKKAINDCVSLINARKSWLINISLAVIDAIQHGGLLPMMLRALGM